MTNKTQSNAKRLLSILAEGKIKKKKAPIVIFTIFIILVAGLIITNKENKDQKERYLMSRGSYLSKKDIQLAIKENIDLTKLGPTNRHIIYFMADDLFSLEMISEVQKSGFDLFAVNNNNENALEQVLIYKSYSPYQLKTIVAKNYKTLLDLKFKASDEAIRKASETCSKNNPQVCLSTAYYFREIKLIENSKSYAKRTCYEPVNKYLCEIAKKDFLGKENDTK